MSNPELAYPELWDKMENDYEDKIYDDNPSKMRDNMKKWASPHLNNKNERIFVAMANSLYKESFDNHRTKEGYHTTESKYGKRYFRNRRVYRYE